MWMWYHLDVDSLKQCVEHVVEDIFEVLYSKVKICLSELLKCYASHNYPIRQKIFTYFINIKAICLEYIC